MTNASGVIVAPSLRGERAVAVARDRELQAEVLGVGRDLGVGQVGIDADADQLQRRRRELLDQPR